jgi:hypothetical protein
MTAITITNTKKTIACMSQILALAVMLDAMVLFLSLAQIASGDKIGYWSPFWQSQVRLIVSLLK